MNVLNSYKAFNLKELWRWSLNSYTGGAFGLVGKVPFRCTNCYIRLSTIRQQEMEGHDIMKKEKVKKKKDNWMLIPVQRSEEGSNGLSKKPFEGLIAIQF